MLPHHPPRLAVRRQLRKAGELAVGQFLDDTIRRDDYRVFNDLVERDGDKVLFNVDHVIVGPAGVFVLETKTRSKPAVSKPIIEFDGERIRVDGGPSDDGPIKQVEANTRHVREILAETTGRRDIPIQAVVLFPGWWVENQSNGCQVWVLEPKALPKWLANEERRLSSEDIALYASRLASHSRGGGDQ